MLKYTHTLTRHEFHPTDTAKVKLMNKETACEIYIPSFHDQL